MLLLLGGGIILRNFFLNQIKERIQESLNYADLHLSFFPPALILEDVKTTSLSPFFSAKKVTIKISYRSLLTRERPLTVFIEQPVLSISETLAEVDEEGKSKALFPLPFAIERGLVKGGELYLWRKESNLHSSGIRALFRQKKDYYSFQAEAEENTFFLLSTNEQLAGKVKIAVEGRGREISIKKVFINGTDFIAKGEGSLINPSDPELQLKTSLNLKTALIARIFALPFAWQGKAEGKGELRIKRGEISFKTDLRSSDLILNKIPLGQVDGQVKLSGRGGSVELRIQKTASPQEFVRIDFSGKKVQGIARQLHLEPIMSYVALPWPVKSTASGNFTIDQRKLEADVEFQDESLSPDSGKYPFRGRVKLFWDGQEEMSFSSQGLQSSFATVDLDGKVRPYKNVDISIRGECSDAKQAREFVSLVLLKNFEFPEIRGKGIADIVILGDYKFPQVKANFSFPSAGFDKFEASSVEGEAEVIKNEFRGHFRINDPFLKGEIEVFANENDTGAKIRLTQGSAEKILPALDIFLPLQGRGSGNFEIRQKIHEEPELVGEFSSSQMKLADQNLKDVKGKIEWKENALSFPELEFLLHEGRIKGHGRLDIINQEFDIDLSGERINLSSLYPELQGKLAFDIKGKGFLGRDLALGKFKIEGLEYSPFQKVETSGELDLGYTENKLHFNLKGNLSPGENQYTISLNFPVDTKIFGIEIKGNFNNLDLLLPWTGAKGRINYLAEIRGEKPVPQLNGVIDFQGTLLPFPRFAHALTDYSGLIFVQNNRASLRSFQGKLGGGDVQGSGEVRLGKGGVENINLSAEGKNMLLSPLERTRALADGAVRFIKDPNRFVLEGNFFIQRLTWRREITEKFVFYSAPYYEEEKKPFFFDDLTLDIRLKADDNAWMENSLGRIRGRFDLTVTGNVNEPIVLGDLETLSGDVYFQDRKFKILKGRVSFFNPLVVEPYLDFKGETYVKDYRVNFTLSGLIAQLKPEFSSSPPLSPEDVLALLALGEAFKRTTSYDTSTQLSTASLLSFQIAEEAKRRAEKLFSIDRFRIDPFIMGSSAEMTARLTVGKKISSNLFILYSTNLTTQREEIVRLEWELSDDFSVVGVRDELGRISFDVKVRKRF